MIGRHFSDPLLQEDIKHYPFTVKAAAGDKPMIEVQFKGEAKTFSPEEISSMVLTKMRDIASAFVGEVGSNIVIVCLLCFRSRREMPAEDW
jgi:L1 cell adhesion molecule like protein